MNNVYDLGGMHGFGPVEYEQNQTPFHEEWEPRVLALRFATEPWGLFGSLDASRYALEKMDPAIYFAAGYYERWLINLEEALVEKGHLTPAEIDARTEHYRQHPDAPVPRHEDLEWTRRVLELRFTPERLHARAESPPRFRVGDTVRTRNINHRRHTRLPRYARGKRGIVVHLQGIQLLPDHKAHNLEPRPQQVYNVRFEGRELWGDDAEPGTFVDVDVWDSYLEPA